MEPMYAQSVSVAGDRIAEDRAAASSSAVWGKEIIFTVEEIQMGSVLQVEMTVLGANRQTFTASST